MAGPFSSGKVLLSLEPWAFKCAAARWQLTAG